jgi:hypothetical protein
VLWGRRRLFWSRNGPLGGPRADKDLISGRCVMIGFRSSAPEKVDILSYEKVPRGKSWLTTVLCCLCHMSGRYVCREREDTSVVKMKKMSAGKGKIQAFIGTQLQFSQSIACSLSIGERVFIALLTVTPATAMAVIPVRLALAA